jgi:hypothetical protein
VIHRCHRDLRLSKVLSRGVSGVQTGTHHATGSSAVALPLSPWVPSSPLTLELTRLRIGIRSEPCLPIRLCVFRQLLDVAYQESIPLFAAYNRLSKLPSSKTVETVRSRHFAASFARAASACCTRFSASTPRISRTGTSSLFASCTITSAIFRGSPSERPSRLRNILSIEPTGAS